MPGLTGHRKVLTVTAACAVALAAAACGRLGGPYQRGQRLLEAGDAAAAVDAFTEAIESGNDVAKAYAWRCYANLAAERNDNAVKDCTEALDRMGAETGAPEGDSQPYYKWELLNNRGVAHLNLDLRDEAEADLGAAIELKPDYAEAYANRGRFYVDGEDWEKAKEDLTRAIELEPALAEAHGNRGRVYEGLGDGDAALADYGKAIELSRDTTAYFNRGMLYYAMGNFDAAFEDFTSVVELEEPDSYLSYMAQQQVDFLARRPTGLPGPTAASP